MEIFGQINIAMFDTPWSIVHAVSGFTIGATLTAFAWLHPARRFWMAGIALLMLWELTEMTLRYLDIHAHDAIAPFKLAVSGFAFAPESSANTIGDLIIGAVGLEFGRRLGRNL